MLFREPMSRIYLSKDRSGDVPSAIGVRETQRTPTGFSVPFQLLWLIVL